MNRPLVWGALACACAALPLVLAACEDIGTAAVSISPTYGWADGCTPVKISGHGFGDDVTATINGEAVTDIALPDAETNPLDVGYLFYATAPAGEPGSFGQVEVTTGGETYTFGGETTKSGYFYFTECPGMVLEGADYPEAVTSGDTISLSGCGMDASALSASVGGETIPLTSVCSSAQVTFDAPALDDGSYEVVFVNGDGDQVYPTPGCGPAADTGAVDTGFPCESTITLTYGGAR